MKRWSLKMKVSVYCTLLTVLGLVSTACIILPIVYYNQLRELDNSLRENAKALSEELTRKLRAEGRNARQIMARDIPLSLQGRYIVIESPEGAEIFRGRQSRFQKIDLSPHGDGPVTLPVGDRNARFVSGQYGPWKIWVGTGLGVLEKVQKELLFSFLAVIPLITGLVFLGAIFLSRRSLQPVSAMTIAAERISAQSPDERLPQSHGAEEITRLTVVLNQSFDRLQRAYTSAARFSADASHQLKTPIAVLRAGLDELRMCDYLEPQDRETLDTLMQQTRRLTTLVEDLLLLAQADAGRLKLEAAPIDLAPLLAVAFDDTQALGGEKELAITLDAPETLYAKADPRRVKIILQNLTENAVKYNQPGGKLRITASREGPWAIITVANTGSTIPEQYRDRLFDRFNRAGMGENIKGHGLGLNIARELARAHGGDLVLQRSEEGWTEFAVKLPASEPPAAQRVEDLQTAAV